MTFCTDRTEAPSSQINEGKAHGAVPVPFPFRCFTGLPPIPYEITITNNHTISAWTKVNKKMVEKKTRLTENVESEKVNNTSPILVHGC